MSQAEEICAGIRTLHDEAVSLAESVIFMAKKLEETRNEIENEPLIIEYDNGGGQCGIRENPHYTAYEKLQASFNKSFKQLLEMVEKGAPSSTSSDVLSRLNVIAGKKVG
jgi:hypothetical protein